MLQKKTVFFLFLFPLSCFASPPPEDACNNLLALIDRPTAADSPCVVKSGQALIESGYQYVRFNPGIESNFPETTLRIGLPQLNELTLVMPDYFTLHSEGISASGNSAALIGIKHQFPIIGKWTYAIETLVVLPTGSSQYGSNGTGAIFNGIVNYAVTPAISLAAMVGLFSETEAFNAGGQRFNSFNPDFIASWQATDTIQFYAEVYGQTKGGFRQGSIYSADGGIQFLLNKNIEVDVEYGHRIKSIPGGFEDYIGLGGGIRF